MPKKIRELKRFLLKAGFVCEPGKGSHTKWSHPLLSEKLTLSGKDGTLSGKDGDDAKPYQEKDVNSALQQLAKIQGEEQG